MAEQPKTESGRLIRQFIVDRRHVAFLKKRHFLADKSYSETVREALDLLMQKDAKRGKR